MLSLLQSIRQINWDKLKIPQLSVIKLELSSKNKLAQKLDKMLYTYIQMTYNKDERHIRISLSLRLRVLNQVGNTENSY